MKQTKLQMGMPITVEIVDPAASQKDLEQVFAYFDYIEHIFSPFIKDSEISLINRGKILPNQACRDVKTILRLAKETQKKTGGYFDIRHQGKLDPSGIVKGWAINRSALSLRKQGFRNFYIEAGGDVAVYGKAAGRKWRVGIRNPFNQTQIIKVIEIENKGVATSGTYIRGQHIYNPKKGGKIEDIVSLTVIGPNIDLADRMATASFAMGKFGIQFIESQKGFEGYLVDKKGIATQTRGFAKYETS